MELSGRVRYVSALIDGSSATTTREGSDDAIASEVVHADETRIRQLLSQGQRQGGRYVDIRCDRLWHVALECRGGLVTIGVDRRGDPFEVAAGASEVLLAHGR